MSCICYDMERRGELSSQEIVVLVLALGAFIIVALFLFGIFNNEDLTERELCRLSILERATVPSVAAQAIPLQCSTEKICITAEKSFLDFFRPAAAIGVSKKSDCKQFAGEQNVREVKVKMDDNPSHQAETLKIIEGEVANAMYDCWAVTGQGKLDVFRGTTEGAVQTGASVLSDLFGTEIGGIIRDKKPQCIVCSRIALSEELAKQNEELKKKENIDILSKINVNDYMARELVPRTSLTYLQTFTDESVRSYAGIDKIDKNEETGNKYAKASVGATQIAIVFMQIKTEENPTDVAEQAAILTGTAIGGGGLMTAIGRKVIRTVPILSTVVALAATGGAYLAAKSAAEENQAVSFALCKEYDKYSSKLGCSLVKPIEWNIEKINGLCYGGIEGNL